MDLKNRKRRDERPKSEQPITTITNIKNKSKQDSPTCYRFSDYDKAEIALSVANANVQTNVKVTPAKLLRALVRLNNKGVIDEQLLINTIESL
ncbi:hypothetical protein ACU5EH_22340 [Aliivibrio salmonicida]|uniref:hypothetical protein n=1 Tax=Aliivibrio salmonicida TaxID=40269 RepID=UPI00406CF147